MRLDRPGGLPDEPEKPRPTGRHAARGRPKERPDDATEALVQHQRNLIRQQQLKMSRMADRLAAVEGQGRGTETR